MIIAGIDDADYTGICLLLRAERLIIKRRVEMLIKNECGVGFSLVSDCLPTVAADKVSARSEGLRND